MENTENITQLWQVDTGGDIFDANLEDMQAWIADGSLLRIDRVRKGNLRWIEAGKVPQLLDFFNAKDAGDPIQPTVTTTHVELLGVAPPAKDLGADTAYEQGQRAADSQSVFDGASIPQDDGAGSVVCSVHPDVEAAYGCDSCAQSFCKTCPTGYGATVKICPFCGAMCRSLAAPVVQSMNYQQQTRAAATESFGFGDFGKALAYPFKFKFSLVIGAIMFAFFSLGSGAGGFGGIFAMVGGIVCMMCANMLSFGVLATTVENFSQGKLDDNFMPSFDDFSIWDDVVHPFFLSIGVYISSFGPFIAVVLVAIFMVVGATNHEENGFQEDAARAVNPELPYAAKAADQSLAVKELIRQANDQQKKRVEMMQDRERMISDEVAAAEEGREPAPSDRLRASETFDQEKWHNPSAPAPAASTSAAGVVSDPDAEAFESVNKMIQENRKAQLESVVGKTSETKAEEQAAFFKQVLGYGILFLLLGGITLLWGLFYFPAACAVAGYTQSFAATLNPTVGLDTIKRLGGSYALILLMALFLLIVSTIVSGILGIAFAVFDLPGLGNLPAKFFGSMFGFYIAVVFSCILGYALFKKADRLHLPS